MSATLPPPRKPKISEAEIDAVINKGGRTTKEANVVADIETPKHINIRLTGQILSEIDQRRSKRPRKPGSPKPGISIHDWIVEAVLEKLEKEKK